MMSVIRTEKMVKVEEEKERPGKVIFLGLAESGKTTIIKTLMDGYDPRNALGKYNATINFERKHFTHLEKKITIFDLGGQLNFLDRFTGEMAKFIFSNVNAMVFVIDSANVSELTRVKYYLDITVERITRYSPKTPIYILIHKTDLLNQNMVDDITNNLRIFMKSDQMYPLQFYNTTVIKNRGETVFNAFKAVLSNIAGDSDIVTLESEGPVTPVTIMQSFIKENQDIVKTAQLLAENGTPILSSRDYRHVTKFDVRRALDNALQYLSNSMEVTNTSLFVSEDKIHITEFTKDGKILLISFSKEGIKDKGENIPSIYDKVMLLVKKIDKYS
ncbi:MAG: ADP-ribosylation factor-like protein [Candidatus Hodarchaeales archaeon]